ncbi:S8 family serine peptidase [Yinghuangia sp. YIM S10712]|uniref:S8 family serine peptidase n=1 Tax=Yinghuangia sp. YIM S10712 TaxID=3436930 RepID=UPI003F53703C
MCVVLAVVAAVLVVVMRDDGDAASARVRPEGVLTERQLALLRKAVPDPGCDAATSGSAPADTALVALDVMRVEGTCLSFDTEYLPADQVPARREALSRDPAVVAAAVAPPMWIDRARAPLSSSRELPVAGSGFIAPGHRPTALPAAADDRRGDQWPLDLLGVPSGSTELPWPDGTGVVVAVLDTGVDSSHPDLADAVIGRRHYEGEGAPDPAGHGTHVAGIIAARHGNGGITGVAPGVSVLDVPVRLQSANDQAPNWWVGLTWAVNHGADVANMSFGGPYSYYSMPEHRGSLELGAAAVEFARRAQVVLIASGGNCGGRFAGNPLDKDCGDRNERQVPSVYEGVVNVGALDDDRELTSYSTKNDDIDLVAPGGDHHGPPELAEGGMVLSDAPGGGFDRMLGTSQAAPHVAAAAAIGRFVRPQATAGEIARAIIDTADQSGVSEDDRGKKGTGNGFLDISGMAERLRLGPSAPAPSPGSSQNPTAPAADPAARTQAAYVQDGTLFAYDGTTSHPVRRVTASPPRWIAWSSDHTLLVGADDRTLFSWAGPGTQVVEKPCDWCADDTGKPALVDNVAVTDPAGGEPTGDLVLRMAPDGTLTRFNAHTLDGIGSSPAAFPADSVGSKSLHGAVGRNLLVHESGGAQAAERLWLVDPVTGQVVASPHDVTGSVLGGVAVSADGTKAAVVTGYGACGRPEGMYVFAGGDLRDIARPSPPAGVMVDDLYFNGSTLYASMSQYAMSSGQPCRKYVSAGVWRLDGDTWQPVAADVSAGRPLEGRQGAAATGWITVRGTDAVLVPASPDDPDKGALGRVAGMLWSTPTRTEVPLRPQR